MTGGRGNNHPATTARLQFTLFLVCQHCGELGAVVWEESRYVQQGGPRRRLVTTHGRFHSENGRTNSGDPVIVCSRCDEIQPD